MRLLALAAFAVLSATPALARHVIAQDGYCNVGVIRTSPSDRMVLYSETSPPSCENVIGIGVRSDGTYNGIPGDWLAIGELNDHYPSEPETMVYQYPFVTGGRWFLYGTTDAKTLILINSGTYSILNDGSATPRSGKPVSSGS
jgi:hypothetical protein